MIQFVIRVFGVIMMCQFLMVHSLAQSLESSPLIIKSELNGVVLCSTVNNAKKNLKIISNKDQLVLLFISPECPLCQSYSSVLNNIYKRYNTKVDVIGILPGRTFSQEQIAAYVSKYAIEFPLYIDKYKKLSSLLGATTVPEAIVVSRKTTIEYSGKIDNWVVKLGKRRDVPTDFYLINAIESILMKQNVVIKHVDPIGCLINDY